MRKILLFLLFFTIKNIVAQNGLTTYSASITGSISPVSETNIFIDNAGNKWVSFFNGNFNSAAAFGVYTNSTSTWTFWNKTTVPILPNNRANCFAQDNFGNIWIGMNGALIKYDGTNFTLYNTSSGLPDNSVYTLEYSNNMLYIGTGNGLSRYDGITFTNYNIGNGLLPLGIIRGIKAETPTTIWLTGGNSLVKLLFNSSYTSSSYTTAVTSSTTMTLWGIYIDALGNKWASSTDTIVKYDNSNFSYTSVSKIVGISSINPYTLAKGPNNGVLFVGNYTWPNSGKSLVELMPTGNYNLYNFPSNISIGTYIARETSGKIFMTGAITNMSGIVARIHSFDYANYTTTGSFGLGSGGGINSNNFKHLDVNRVNAGIMNRGDMWWDPGNTGGYSYEVPKGTVPFYGCHSGYAASLWIGGLDASNQLHASAQTYRQKGNDFWPGPLDTTNAFIDTVTAVNYDKIWKIDYNDINTFITQFNLGNVPLTYTPTPDILNWPAKGTGNKSRNLAPFVDVNNNGIYDPLVGGDYPKIKGDQTLYFIFNDKLGPHTETGGLPFGVEVHTMAYAYGCPNILNGRNELAYTTFYDYKIYNRSNNNYHDVSLGLWTDVDLGVYSDDYLACSIHDNLGFCYNSDGADGPTGGFEGYFNYPPAVGTTILKGPIASINDLKDNDNDSIIDEPGEECLMNVFDCIRYQSIGPSYDIHFPQNKYQYHNYLQARWKDSSNFTCGGNAYGGTVPTNFVYPWTNYLGNPCAPGWDEFSAGNLSGNQRYVISSGPFNFPAGSMTEFEFAQVWSVDSSATSNINIASANKLIQDTRKIRSFYKSGLTGCVGKGIGIHEFGLNADVLIYPNPANSVLNIKSESGLGRSVISITDVLGKTLLETRNDNLYNQTLNIESLSSGVYFLNIKSEKGQSVKKFVKQ